jgi:hypothetical protein
MEVHGMRLDGVGSEFQDRSAQIFSNGIRGSVDRLEKEHPGYDLYCPRSAAAQLNTSESFFRESVKTDSSAPVIMRRGVIACNTPALQKRWDDKKHHSQTVRDLSGP